MAKPLQIRGVDPQDAAILLDFGRTLLDETDHFVRTTDERAGNVDEMRMVCEAYRDTPGWCMLHAWQDDLPVGEAIVMAGQTLRTRHCAAVGIGVLKTHWRQGIGAALLQATEAFARANGIIRLELEVFTENEPAIALYRRFGYSPEGIKRRAIRIHDADNIRWVDEWLMAKLLDESQPDLPNP